MRLPALAIAAAFAGGIALGLYPGISRHASSRELIVGSFLVAAFVVATGFLLAKFGWLYAAGSASVLSWIVLGVLAACVSQQPQAPEQVISLIERGQLEVKTPLRWHGQLRDEPARLPWGYGYEIELSGVEYERALRHVIGGLRVNFAPKETTSALPAVHAGDEVTVLTEARRPQMFRDEGAFDRRAYLEQQGLHLWSRGFQKLDVVALTHAHQDHLGGLKAIMENFRVGELWIGREISLASLANLEEPARRKGIPIKHECKGQSFSWDSIEGRILWLEADFADVATVAQNDDSLVMRLHYGERSFMLPGDAERRAEEGVLSANAPEAPQADVLKVGHHGGKNSTTVEFLEAVRPQVGIISAGEGNPYGHPSTGLLERLDNAGVRILRTDRDGAVHVLTDGRSLQISCFSPCEDRRTDADSMQAQAPNQKHSDEKQ
jgi:beta-lactamase superfamily II metal-dependent hydrolase